MVLTSHLCVLFCFVLLYALTDWLCINEVACVYCAVIIEPLHIQRTTQQREGMVVDPANQYQKLYLQLY